MNNIETREFLKKGDLELWLELRHKEEFTYMVEDIKEAKSAMLLLNTFTMHLGHQDITDVCDQPRGLRVWDGKYWNEWEDKDGSDLDDILDRETT